MNNTHRYNLYSNEKIAFKFKVEEHFYGYSFFDVQPGVIVEVGDHISLSVQESVQYFGGYVILLKSEGSLGGRLVLLEAGPDGVALIRGSTYTGTPMHMMKFGDETWCQFQIVDDQVYKRQDAAISMINQLTKEYTGVINRNRLTHRSRTDYSAANANNTMLLIARDVNNTATKEYMVYKCNRRLLENNITFKTKPRNRSSVHICKPDSLCDNLKRLNKHCYEVIKPGDLARLFLDIEWEGDSEKEIQIRRLATVIQTVIEMKGKGSTANVNILECCRPNKKGEMKSSFHLIFPSITFKNMGDMSVWIRLYCDFLRKISFDQSHPLYNRVNDLCLIEKDHKKFTSSIWKTVIDTKVYTNYRLFRFEGQSKAGSDFKLRPISVEFEKDLKTECSGYRNCPNSSFVKERHNAHYNNIAIPIKDKLRAKELSTRPIMRYHVDMKVEAELNYNVKLNDYLVRMLEKAPTYKMKTLIEEQLQTPYTEAMFELSPELIRNAANDCLWYQDWFLKKQSPTLSLTELISDCMDAAAVRADFKMYYLVVTHLVKNKTKKGVIDWMNHRNNIDRAHKVYKTCKEFAESDDSKMASEHILAKTLGRRLPSYADLDMFSNLLRSGHYYRMPTHLGDATRTMLNKGESNLDTALLPTYTNFVMGTKVMANGEQVEFERSPVDWESTMSELVTDCIVGTKDKTIAHVKGFMSCGKTESTLSSLITGVPLQTKVCVLVGRKLLLSDLRDRLQVKYEVMRPVYNSDGVTERKLNLIHYIDDRKGYRQIVDSDSKTKQISLDDVWDRCYKHGQLNIMFVCINSALNLKRTKFDLLLVDEGETTTNNIPSMMMEEARNAVVKIGEERKSEMAAASRRSEQIVAYVNDDQHTLATLADQEAVEIESIKDRTLDDIAEHFKLMGNHCKIIIVVEALYDDSLVNHIQYLFGCKQFATHWYNEFYTVKPINPEHGQIFHKIRLHAEATVVGYTKREMEHGLRDHVDRMMDDILHRIFVSHEKIAISCPLPKDIIRICMLTQYVAYKEGLPIPDIEILCNGTQNRPGTIEERAKRCQVFIYNSAMSAGHSITCTEFDRVYAFVMKPTKQGEVYGPPLNEALQMMGRCRRVRTKTLHVCLVNTPSNFNKGRKKEKSFGKRHGAHFAYRSKYQRNLNHNIANVFTPEQCQMYYGAMISRSFNNAEFVKKPSEAIGSFHFSDYNVFSEIFEDTRKLYADISPRYRNSMFYIEKEKTYVVAPVVKERAEWICSSKDDKLAMKPSTSPNRYYVLYQGLGSHLRRAFDGKSCNSEEEEEMDFEY